MPSPQLIHEHQIFNEWKNIILVFLRGRRGLYRKHPAVSILLALTGAWMFEKNVVDYIGIQIILRCGESAPQRCAIRIPLKRNTNVWLENMSVYGMRSLLSC